MKHPQIVIHNHLGQLKCPTAQNEPAGDLGLILYLFADMTYIKIIYYFQGSKLTFLLGSTGAPNFKKLGAPQLF